MTLVEYLAEVRTLDDGYDWVVHQGALYDEWIIERKGGGQLFRSTSYAGNKRDADSIVRAHNEGRRLLAIIEEQRKALEVIAEFKTGYPNHVATEAIARIDALIAKGEK